MPRYGKEYYANTRRSDQPLSILDQRTGEVKFGKVTTNGQSQDLSCKNDFGRFTVFLDGKQTAFNSLLKQDEDSEIDVFLPNWKPTDDIKRNHRKLIKSLKQEVLDEVKRQFPDIAGELLGDLPSRASPSLVSRLAGPGTPSNGAESQVSVTQHGGINDRENQNGGPNNAKNQSGKALDTTKETDNQDSLQPVAIKAKLWENGRWHFYNHPTLGRISTREARRLGTVAAYILFRKGGELKDVEETRFFVDLAERERKRRTEGATSLGKRKERDEGA